MIKNSKLKKTSIFAGLAIVVALVFAFALTYFSTATADEETPSNDPATITIHIENFARCQKELPDLKTQGEHSIDAVSQLIWADFSHDFKLDTSGSIQLVNENDGHIHIYYTTPDNKKGELNMYANHNAAEYSWFYALDKRVQALEDIVVTEGETINLFLGYNDNVDFFRMQVDDKNTHSPIPGAGVVAKATQAEFYVYTKTEGKGLVNINGFREHDFPIEVSITAAGYPEEHMIISVEETKQTIHVLMGDLEPEDLLVIKSSSENHKEFHLKVDSFYKGEYLETFLDLTNPEIVLTNDDIEADVFDFTVLENGDIFIDQKFAKPTSNETIDELKITLSAVANDPSYILDKWVIGDKEYAVGDTGSIDLVSATDTITVDAKYKLAQAEATELAQTGDSLPFNVAAIMLGILVLAGCGLVVSRKFN